MNELRQQLQSFESLFKLEHGRKPSEYDIKQQPLIAQRYKQYRRLKHESAPPPPDPNHWQAVFNQAPLGPSPTKNTFTPLFPPHTNTVLRGIKRNTPSTLDTQHHTTEHNNEDVKGKGKLTTKISSTTTTKRGHHKKPRITPTPSSHSTLNTAKPEHKTYNGLIVHPRRPYNTTPTFEEDDEPGEIRDPVQSYRDQFDLLRSGDVFTRANSQIVPLISSNHDLLDNQPLSSCSAGNTPDSPSSTTSLDPSLLDLLSLHSEPLERNSIKRERARNLIVKKLLMEPIERERNERIANGLQELIFAERRNKGLGTKFIDDELEGEEEEEEEGGWASEVEGWKDVGDGVMEDWDRSS